MPDWAGLGFDPALVSFCRPPHSVVDHGLGNRASKLRHKIVSVSCSFIVALLTPSSALSRRVVWLLKLWHKRVWYFVIFSLLYMVFCLFFVVRFQLLCRPFPPSPDSGMCYSRKVTRVRRFHFVLVFVFLHLTPRHAGGPQEGFDVGFPRHSACVFLQSPFSFWPPPPRWRSVGGFSRWFALPCRPCSQKPALSFSAQVSVFPGRTVCSIKEKQH